MKKEMYTIMKKFVVALLAFAMLFSLAACGGNGGKAATPLADEGHAAWVAHGQYLLADGTENAWNGKDTALYEASALKAIAVEDVKAIDNDLYTALSGKDVKYLYTIDLLFGTNDAGWTTNFLDRKSTRLNSSHSWSSRMPSSA